MTFGSQVSVVDRVIERLKAIDLSPIGPSMIYHADFPFDRAPSIGIAVSELTESEGTGTIGHDDFMYGVQLTRILGSKGHGSNRGESSRWRYLVRREFHRKLLGEIEGEIITKVRPSTIKLSRQWSNWGIDASVMEIWCHVREERYERLQ